MSTANYDIAQKALASLKFVLRNNDKYGLVAKTAAWRLNHAASMLERRIAKGEFANNTQPER